MVLGILIGWIVFSYAFAYLIPHILAGIAWAWLFVCYQIFRVLYWLWHAIRRWSRAFGRWYQERGAEFLRDYALLAYFLIKEAIWPSPDEEFEEEDTFEDEYEYEDEEEEQPPSPSAYGDALATLSLADSFTKDEFKKAFRRAINSAHPDKGGSTQAAQAVYKARDLIIARHGWT